MRGLLRTKVLPGFMEHLDKQSERRAQREFQEIIPWLQLLGLEAIVREPAERSTKSKRPFLFSYS